MVYVGSIGRLEWRIHQKTHRHVIEIFPIGTIDKLRILVRVTILWAQEG